MRTPRSAFFLSILAAVACIESAGPGAGDGAVRITTVTTGPDPDAAYRVFVDGGSPMPLAAGAAVVLDSLAPGSHSVLLAEIAPNCVVGDPNPANITVVTGDTSAVAFDVTCTPKPGAIRVSMATTGPYFDIDYLVVLDGGTTAWSLLDSPVVFEDVAPGSHTVRLLDVASNCWISGWNPVTVTVGAVGTVDIVFTLTCPQYRTGVDVTLATTGTQPDESYDLWICDSYCDFHVWHLWVPANATVQHEISNRPGGRYWLADVAENCTGPTEGTFSIAGRQVAQIRIDIVCTAPAGVRASSPATGSGAGSGIAVVKGASP